MSIFPSDKCALFNIIATTAIALFIYCGLASSLAQAGEQLSPQDIKLGRVISELTIEGLSLTQLPAQAHETLISAGFQMHSGNEPGHGIYWKNETKALTKRIRLKSSVDRIYQIQFSFAEKNGNKAWLTLFNKIKNSLGAATQLCEAATEQALSCLLVSESPTQLSAEITTSQSAKINRIKVRLDQRTSKISVKSKMSFGSPRKQ